MLCTTQPQQNLFQKSTQKKHLPSQKSPKILYQIVWWKEPLSKEIYIPESLLSVHMTEEFYVYLIAYLHGIWLFFNQNQANNYTGQHQL